MSVKTPRAYAAPLCALDQVVRLDQSGIATRKAVSPSEAFFAGHFPEYPIFPGVFIIEAVHQAALYYAANYVGRVTISELRSVRFLSPVLPGDLLELDCRCVRMAEPDGFQVDATCHCGSRKIASVKLTYRLEQAHDVQSCGTEDYSSAPVSDVAG